MQVDFEYLFYKYLHSYIIIHKVSAGGLSTCDLATALIARIKE
ncbi:hypothetical protein RV02_GL001691 [Enterococcus gilvus]|nr:hypothetical protein RV02_GL001691 [Enterococcus gilvus]